MPKGGRRSGAGRPKGSLEAKTLEKAELRRLLRERIAREWDSLIDAWIYSAKGVTHLLAKDRDGTFVQVTDPAVMCRVLNSGEAFYRITARNPDVRALKDITEQVIDKPMQGVEVGGAEGGPLVVKWQES